MSNPYIRGWINYYGHFYRSALYWTLNRVARSTGGPRATGYGKVADARAMIECIFGWGKQCAGPSIRALPGWRPILCSI
jgi:hypothetical protein